MLYVLKKVKGLLVKAPLDEIDADLVKKAKIQHAGYVLSGVLIGDYDDDVWILDGQTRRSGLNFARKRKELKGICENRGMDYDRIVQTLKIYTILRIDTSTPSTLGGQIGYFIDELVRSGIGTVMENPKARTGFIEYYIDLLRVIPEISEDYLQLCCRTAAELRQELEVKRKDKDHATRLNEFLSYFEFDDMLRRWWAENTDMDKKLFFYPLYLFWVITTILPLRVTEFCVTPLDCIMEKDGRYFLTIRRSKLKGSSSAYPTIRYHKIAQDYTLHSYEIPRWLYDEIAMYREQTGRYSHPYELLLSVDAMLHLNYGISKTGEHQKPFGSQELRECMTFFYADVLEMERGYRIVSEEDLLERSRTEEGTYEMDEREIMLIHPKETRHIAMINLILRGANPMTIKEFAGHTDATTSAHYYSNMANTVRCATKYIYNRYRASGGSVDYTRHIRVNPASLLIDSDDPHVQVDGGYCYSPDFLVGMTTDCRKCAGKCQACGFFMKDRRDEYEKEGTDTDEEMVAEIEEKKESIDAQMDYYVKMLGDPNLDDKIEEFQVRTLKLEESAVDLSTQIWQDFIRRSHEKEKNKA